MPVQCQKPVDGIAADLRDDSAATVAADQDRAVGYAPGIGVGHAAFAKGVLEGRTRIAHGLLVSVMGAAEDDEAAQVGDMEHPATDALIKAKVHILAISRLCRGCE